MPLPAQKFREMVFQMLYCCDYGVCDRIELIDFMMNELKVTKKSAMEAYQKMQLVVARQEEIDALIRPASHDYQFERISSAEKNILRLGIFEMCYDESIPMIVAISEAIRLCRKFGTPESAEFVNAIMDSIHKGSSCASKGVSSLAGC